MAFIRVEATPDLRKYITTIFTDEFMQKYTNFTCFMDFQSSSSVFLNWGSILWVYNEEVFERLCAIHRRCKVGKVVTKLHWLVVQTIYPASQHGSFGCGVISICMTSIEEVC